MKCFTVIFICLTLLMIGCQQKTSTFEAEDQEKPTPAFLPFEGFILNDLSEFYSEGTNWKIGSVVFSDFGKAWDLSVSAGTGVLANVVEDRGKRDQQDAAKGAHLFTVLEHGDIALELEVLVPKESNSGLYFQSRYELQIRDTADDPDVSPDDMGGIYTQWKDEDNIQETTGGSAPQINAARTPGLWQSYRILFRAPRFDRNGEKIKNALFEYVYLNGFLIQENVEVSGPTIEAPHNDEVAKAPLMIQGDHGPVALRNIAYKTYDRDEVILSNINYRLFKGQYDFIPDFTQLELTKTGQIENFENLPEIAGQNDGFSLEIEADLLLPRDGTYLFETIIDDGGDLFIDDALVVHNQGEPGEGTERGIIELTKGQHKLKQTYYQEVWGSTLIISVEGPSLEKTEIPLRPTPKEIPSWAKRQELKITVGDEPELIRGFVDHNGTKKTHILSVGTPEGVHYSYDTRNNELINVWKGEFADVSRMWNNRGQTQRLDPLGAELGLETDAPGEECKPTGYTLDQSGIPVFNYKCGSTIVTDRTGPSVLAGTVVRNISVDKGKYKYTVATGEYISELSDGWYSVGNKYYIRPKKEGATWNVLESKIVADISNSKDLTYEIYW